MKSTSLFALVAGLALATGLQAQVPQLVNYQGRVSVGGTNFNGSGQFKFALVNNGGTPTFWSNNGTSVNGSEPNAAVSLTVVNGLYSVLLGDTSLANMTAVPSTVFTNGDVRLRIWFNDGVSGFQLLTPDQRIAAVGYAMMSANIPDGLITSAKLADGAVTGAKLAIGSITSDKLAANAVSSSNLADTISLGTSNINGRLDVYRTSAGTPGVSIIGNGSQISTYGSDGLEQIRLYGGSWGEMWLNNSLANNATAVKLTAQGATGGQLELRNTNGSNRAVLEGENAGGTLTLYASDGNVGAVLYGSEGQGSGALSLRNTNGSARFRAYGGPASGSLELYDASGTQTIDIDAEPNGNIVVRQGDGSAAVGIYGSNGTGGGGVTVYRDNGSFAGQLTVGGTSGFLGIANSSGNNRVYAQGSNPGGSQGGYLGLINSAGSQTITLDADNNGDGKLTTQVLQITGGSDLSEQFDINSLEKTLQPGLIVCIDPDQPGHLITSHKAYDKTVAGVLSGAGGVKPGMLMGQAGTVADGKHPVALTGRVYCHADASHGAIQPGDLLTTSDTAGHAMKVTDSARAQGAIIGKAMSSLETGKGLVLVLVSLQ